MSLSSFGVSLFPACHKSHALRSINLPQTLYLSLLLVNYSVAAIMDNNYTTTGEDNFSWDYSLYSTQSYYAQTPFPEFAWSVQQLCKTLWPSSFEEISLEDINGGSFNRIVGVSLKSSVDSLSTDLISNMLDQHGNNDYILRVPHHADDPMDGDLIILHYVRSKTSIPVPHVVAFDLSDDNPLGRPYMLQRRIPGVCLSSIIYELTQPQRCQLAIQLARIIRQLIGITSPVPGQLGFPKAKVLQESCTENHTPNNKNSSRTAQNTLQEKLSRMMVGNDTANDGIAPQFLHYDGALDNDAFNGTINHFNGCKPGDVAFACIQFQLTRHMIDSLTSPYPQIFKTKQYTRLLEMAREMHDLGFLADDHYNLFHHDLESRNIMVSIDDVGDLKITGILDWDQTKFVPRFVSCCPPPWLWCYDDDPYFDEATTYETPEDPDMQELKQLFDENVGEEFTKLAYPPQYRIARRLFKLAVEGYYEVEYEQRVDDLICEWTEFRDELDNDDAASMDQEDEAESSLPEEQGMECSEAASQEADVTDNTDDDTASSSGHET